MDLSICINTNSFPAETAEIGKLLLKDAIDGVLQLITDEGERVIFYHDSNDQGLFDLEVAEGYRYEDFVNDCGDVDMQAFLYEVEDKSPAVDALTPEKLEEIAAYSLYIPNQPLDSSRDIFAFAWVLDGYLLSLATAERWASREIRASNLGNQGQYIDDFFILKNIANTEHGKQHFQINTTISPESIVSPHLVSEELKSWFGQQNKENQRIIANKLKLAKERMFQGGEPLFKPLTNSNALREIRFSAFAGGAIRILFRNYKNTIYFLLTGFIKHGDNEGYDQQIPLAEEIFDTYQKTHQNGQDLN